MIVNIFIILLIIVIGLIFFSGKGAVVVEWLNTMPKPDKENRDMHKISVFIGKLFFAAAGCVTIITVGDTFKLNLLSLCGVILLVAIVIFGYFYTHKNKKFNKK